MITLQREEDKKLKPITKPFWQYIASIDEDINLNMVLSKIKEDV